MKAETEAGFQRAVTELAELYGWLVYHTHDSRRSAPGFPDLALAKGGRVILAELKAERGRLSATQERWVREAGAVVWRPSMWELIVATLEGGPCR